MAAATQGVEEQPETADRTPTRRSRRVLSSAELADIRRAYVDHGASPNQIAARYDVSADTIRRRLREAGVSLRDQQTAMTRRYQGGGSVEGLAASLGMEPDAVLVLLREHGFAD